MTSWILQRKRAWMPALALVALLAAPQPDAWADDSGELREEVFRRIRRQAPDLPVILMSGYSEHELSSRFAGRGISAFLQKPLRPAQLLQHVREALGGAPATAPGAQ